MMCEQRNSFHIKVYILFIVASTVVTVLTVSGIRIAAWQSQPLPGKKFPVRHDFNTILKVGSWDKDKETLNKDHNSLLTLWSTSDSQTVHLWSQVHDGYNSVFY